MVSTNELLLNAERLLFDAQFLFAGGRCRSAATLTVVALEQMGAFVEVLTLKRYPDAEVHMGIFGDRANSHAKRQDALAGHVFTTHKASSWGKFSRRPIFRNKVGQQI
jgi:AbiV family abortive infection protein